MIRALIVSDIHALSRDLHNAKGYPGRTGSKLFVEDRTADRNCLLAITEAAGDLAGKIDLLICLGDLAHQAKKSVIMNVWSDLCRVATELKINKLVAVTGNHDVASRPEDFQYEAPSKFLYDIYPPYPLSDESMRQQYKAAGFAVVVVGTACVVLVNTCSLHGYGGSNAAEVFNRGHIDEGTIQQICKAIQSSGAEHYLLAMHHHPRKVDAIHDPDYDQLANGEYLIEQLSKSGVPGIIIHGHKHFASIRRCGPVVNSPWLLSASSLAANAYENMERFFSNQFHVVEIDRPADQNIVRGRMLSWEWGATHWMKSENEVMRHEIGFGAQKPPHEIAAALSSHVNHGFMPISDAILVAPDLPYLTMSEVKELRESLRRHNIELYLGDNEQVSGFFRSGQ